jgi:hypothetical protein
MRLLPLPVQFVPGVVKKIQEIEDRLGLVYPALPPGEPPAAAPPPEGKGFPKIRA